MHLQPPDIRRGRPLFIEANTVTRTLLAQILSQGVVHFLRLSTQEVSVELQSSNPSYSNLHTSVLWASDSSPIIVWKLLCSFERKWAPPYSCPERLPQCSVSLLPDVATAVHLIPFHVSQCNMIIVRGEICSRDLLSKDGMKGCRWVDLTSVPPTEGFHLPLKIGRC